MNIGQIKGLEYKEPNKNGRRTGMYGGFYNYEFCEIKQDSHPTDYEVAFEDRTGYSVLKKELNNLGDI